LAAGPVLQGTYFARSRGRFIRGRTMPGCGKGLAPDAAHRTTSRIINRGPLWTRRSCTSCRCR